MSQMTDDTLRSYLSTCVKQAVGYEDSDITIERAANLRYYRGEPFGNERPGRSDFVSRDVMDTIEWIMPALMDMFHGVEPPVEFAPRRPDNAAWAETATAFVGYVYNHDNDGYRITQTALKEGLISKLGAVKPFYERCYRVEESEHRGLTEEQLILLLSDSEAEVVAHGERQETIDTPQGPAPVTVHDVRLRRQIEEGRIVVEAVPVDEVLISARATSVASADFVAHRTRKMRSELVAQGFDRDVVAGIPADDGDEDTERVNRYEPENNAPGVSGDKLRDPSTQEVTVTECWVLVDYDGDGIAERRKVILGGGNEQVMLSNELVDDDTFMIAWSPILMPHTVHGMAVADAVRDLQELKSLIVRQMIDGLMLSNFPRTEVVEGMVNLDDLLTYRPGGVVRVKAPGQLREMNTTWQGAQAFPMLKWVDETRDGRTGAVPQLNGLDPDSLNNNAGAAANSAMMNAAQMRVKLIARNFAEFFFKPLFQAILKLAVKYQDHPRMVRLTGGFQAIDPRSWNTDMDVVVRVGLGTGDKAERIAALQAVLALQEKALSAGGLGGMVKPENVFEAVHAFQKAAGLGTLRLFNPPQPADPNAPPPPDPEMEKIRAQAEADQAKAQIDAQLAAARIQQDEAMQMRRLEMEERLAVARIEADVATKERQLIAEIGLKERQLAAELALKREIAATQAAATTEKISNVNMGGEPG